MTGNPYASIRGRIQRPRTAIVATIAMLGTVVTTCTASAAPSMAIFVAPAGSAQQSPPHPNGMLADTGGPLALSGIVLLIGGVALLLWIGRRRQNAYPLDAPLY